MTEPSVETSGLKDFWVSKQTLQISLVRAETKEEAEDIVKNKRKVTSKGNVLQAHGFVPDDEGMSTLCFFPALEPTYISYELPKGEKMSIEPSIETKILIKKEEPCVKHSVV